MSFDTDDYDFTDILGKGQISRYGTLSPPPDESSISDDCKKDDDCNYDVESSPNQLRPQLWTFTCAARQGNVVVLGEWASSRQEYTRMAVIGPNFMFILASYALVAGPPILISVYLARIQGLIVALYFSTALSVCLLTALVTSDPGLVPAYKKAQAGMWTFCKKCVGHRPPDSGCVHCTACDVCVLGHHHHCPWIGKCVGAGNKTMFKLFTVSLTWLVVLSLVVSVLSV